MTNQHIEGDPCPKHRGVGVNPECPDCDPAVTQRGIVQNPGGRIGGVDHDFAVGGPQDTPLGPLPADAPWPREECGNRGPRIGEDGTFCRRSKGHLMPHRTSPSDGFGRVEWSDPTEHDTETLAEVLATHTPFNDHPNETALRERIEAVCTDASRRPEWFDRATLLNALRAALTDTAGGVRTDTSLVEVVRGWRVYDDGSRSPVERWVRHADGDWVSLDSNRRTSGDILMEVD